MRPRALRAETLNTRLQLSPPLKWAGGKRWLVPALKQLYQNYSERRLVEPFAGGLSVALGLMPSRALLADINPHAINFYCQLKRGLSTSIRMRNERSSYLRMRQKFNRLVSEGFSRSPEGAELFYYLNRTCFNGLCRFNSDGLFNVPFGRYTNPTYRKDFSAYKNVFRNWKFMCCDFEAVELIPTDFVYADPPYDVEFTRYAQKDFTWKDQERLARWLSSHKGPVIASNQATPRIVELYRGLGFSLAFVSAPRLISCTGDRTRAQEIIATRNIPARLLSHLTSMEPGSRLL